MSNQADHFSAMTDAWTRFTESFVRGAMAANTAAISALDATEDDSQDEDRRPGVDSVDYEELDWASARSVETHEAIAVGDTVEFSKVIDDDDVREFAESSGDTNRLHLDDEFAEQTRFGRRIVHGTLISGIISAALARLPGLTIYLSQDLQFQRPVFVGERVEARVEVVEDLGDGRYRLSTVVNNEDDETVIDGEAVVIIDEFPE